MTLAFISAGFAAILAGLLYLLWRAYQRLARLESDMTVLASEFEHANDELSSVLADVSGSRIIIELINPMTLARNRSRWGAAFVGVAPRMVRRRVYDVVGRELKEKLAENGVDAHLDIFHPTGS